MDRTELILTTATAIFNKAMETKQSLDLNRQSGVDSIAEMGKKFKLLVTEIATIHDSIASKTP